MVNVQRLKQELEFITRNRSHHEQGTWFAEFPENACETAGCLAGWTAIHHAKDQLSTSRAVINRHGESMVRISYEPTCGDWTALGKDLLGLTWEQADTLFSGDNSLWDLWNLASIITRGEIQIPAEVEALRDNEYNRTDGGDYDWLADAEDYPIV